MRHFDFLQGDDLSRLFHLRPSDVDMCGSARQVAHALGATLYSPATRATLVEDLVRARRRGLVSSVVCLEDAIPDSEVVAAQAHTVKVLVELAQRRDTAPLTFVRVRTSTQILEIVDQLGERNESVAGFVLPKFSIDNGGAFLDAVATASRVVGRRLWALPVIETASAMHVESRVPTLLEIRALLLEHRDRVLAVRTGATDLAAIFGLRRPRDLTIYDVRLVADALADIVNVLGRLGDDGFVVSGPVWEYYSNVERFFKPQLRETPFTAHQVRELRASLVAKDLDGLIRECVLDRANGLIGKTVIHPSHVSVVHALSVVTFEEYVDALDIELAASSGGGAAGSNFRNKMNESNPHHAWAETVLRRAAAFGVAREEVSFVDLLAAAIGL